MLKVGCSQDKGTWSPHRTVYTGVTAQAKRAWGGTQEGCDAVPLLKYSKWLGPR